MMIGGKFAPLFVLGDEENLDTVTNTFNEAVTATASQVLGKHRPTKKPWVTADILDMCDERRELKNKKGTTEGANQYREANKKIRKAMRKAKEDWIEYQCSEIEENPEEQHQESLPDSQRSQSNQTGAGQHHTRQRRKVSNRRT